MTLSEAQLHAAFEKEFPGRDWNQNCQAAVAHAAELTTGTATFYLTAKDAFEASNIASTKAAKAALNDVHYWAIGTDWHVGFDLGEGRVFMASEHTDHSFGTNLGVTTVAAYSRATGAVYKGFAHTNGVNHIRVVKPKPTAPSEKVRLIGAYLNAEHLGKTTHAAVTGIVDQTGTVEQVYWWLIQTWGRLNGHYGAGFTIDGKPKRTGGQTRKVEAIIYKLAKAAKK